MVKEEKTKQNKKILMHPAAKTWNDVVDALENVRELWTVHQATYLGNRHSVGRFDVATQKRLSGIYHQQRFDFALEYLTKYARTGFLELKIEEVANAN